MAQLRLSRYGYFVRVSVLESVKDDHTDKLKEYVAVEAGKLLDEPPKDGV